MGTAMRAKARIQINLAVSQVIDIKQVATFPDIVFPIMWFEEVRTIRVNKYIRYFKHTKKLGYASRLTDVTNVTSKLIGDADKMTDAI